MRSITLGGLMLICGITITSCSQAINQVVNVETSKQEALLQQIVERINPTHTPQPLASSDVQQTPAPVLSNPSSPSEAQSASSLRNFDFTIFASKIPRPQAVKDFGVPEIAKAHQQWMIRYKAQRTKAHEVLKMYFDAVLLAAENYELSHKLVGSLLATDYDVKDAFLTPEAYNETFLGGLLYIDEIDHAEIYANATGDRRTNTVEYIDFDQRKLLVVGNKGDYFEKPVPTEEPELLAPSYNIEGLTHTFRVMKKTDRYLGDCMELYFVFRQGGWKLDPYHSGNQIM